MRILFVCRAYHPAVAYGGPVTDVRGMTRALSDRGNEVRVICSNMASTGSGGRSVPSGRYLIDRVQVRFLRTWPRYHWEGFSPAAITAVPRAVRWADLVHVCGVRHFLGGIAESAARRTGTPYVVMPEGAIPPRSRSLFGKRAYDRLLTRRSLASAARVLAKSEAEASDLARWGVRAGSIAILPPHAQLVEPTTEPRRSVRARWGIPPEALVLLWIGRVHPEKGLDLLLEALRDERLREVHAVLAGPVQDRRHAARIRSSVAGPDLRGRIRLLGWVDPAAKADLYALADAFVLPSRKENYGIAAAEALAAGLPLLVTETSGVAELGEELGASSCAPDPAGLADAISRIAHEPGVLDRLEGAARRARSQLTWPPLIDGLEHVYAEATAISSALG